MKMIICLAALIAVAIAAPAVPVVDESQVASVLRYENDNIGVEGYKYGFDTSDGISRDEQGVVQNAGTDQEAISVRGSYSYTYNGVIYTITYVANENGFVPIGDHIPKA